MADVFLDSFNAISTKEERLRALRQLVHIVNFSERQAIGAAVSEKNDIVPALPLELVLQVFQHLHILQTWSLQLVNTRWRQVLSSESFLRASLSHWDTHDRSDSGRCVEDIVRDSVRDRIRHMQSIRRRIPFSEAILENTGTGLQGPQPQLSQSRLDFKGHRIAYISSQSGDSDSVIVRDLVSGAASMLRGEARERIMSVILTTTLVAFVTFDGCLYVTAFSEHMFLHKTLRVKLPSSRIRGCGADNGGIALAMGGGLYESTYVTEILIYGMKTQRLISLPVGSIYKTMVGNVRSLNSCALILDSDNEIVDVFTLVLEMGAVPGRSDGNKSLQIRHIRVSFTGKLLSASSFDHPLPFEITVRSAHFTLAPPQPTGYKGLFRLQVGEIPFMGSLPVRLKFDTLFDIRKAKYVHNQCDSNPDLVTCIGGAAFEDMKRDRLTWGVPNQLHSQWKGRAMTSRDLWCTAKDQNSWLDYMNLVNNTFQVLLEVNQQQTQRSRIRILCFDGNVNMHGGRSTGLHDKYASIAPC